MTPSIVGKGRKTPAECVGDAMLVMQLLVGWPVIVERVQKQETTQLRLGKAKILQLCANTIVQLKVMVCSGV